MIDQLDPNRDLIRAIETVDETPILVVVEMIIDVMTDATIVVMIAGTTEVEVIETTTHDEIAAVEEEATVATIPGEDPDRALLQPVETTASLKCMASTQERSPTFLTLVVSSSWKVSTARRVWCM